MIQILIDIDLWYSPLNIYFCCNHSQNCGHKNDIKHFETSTVFVNYVHKYIQVIFIIMVTLLWKLIQPYNENSCNLTKLKSIIHIYTHICFQRSTNEMPTMHGKQHPLSTAEGFLETANVLRKIAHPWCNPRPPDCMPTIHLCINAFADIFCGFLWHYCIHFYANIYMI